MRFSSVGIALCALQTASAVAIEPRQVALACTPGIKIATYDDLTALPVDDGNTGLLPFPNPYQDLNYTRFSIIKNVQTGNNSLYYTLSQIAAGTPATILSALTSLLGPLGSLPTVLAPPTITGSKLPSTQFRLSSFQFGCSIRTGTPETVIPFPCTITIRPIEKTRAAQSATCTYSGTPGGAFNLATCTPTGLLAGQGFTFTTTAKVPVSQLTKIQSLINPLAESLLVTAFDDLIYKEYCL